jgi:hypothetical protein
MPLIRTEKQKDNLAKFLYDLSKIVLVTAVIAPAVNLSVFSYMALIGGIAVAGWAFVFAYYLDGKEAPP